MTIEEKRNQLLKLYASGKYGIWQILGEDPNCDLGGSHYTPSLAYCQGKYGDVVEYALSLPKFFTWGNGGRIDRIPSITIDRNSAENRKKVLARKKELEQELEQIKKELELA